MATYNLTPITGGVTVIENGGTAYIRPLGYDTLADRGDSVMLEQRPSSGGVWGRRIYTTDSLTVSGSLFSGTSAQMLTLLQTTFAANSGTSGTGSTLKTIVPVGDSQTSLGYDAATKSFSSYGYTVFMQALTSSALYQPSNKGVSGDTTTLIIARMGAVLALKPDVVPVIAGTNDLLTLTAAQTIANLRVIYDGILSSGAVVVAGTILPKFGAVALSAPNETKRQTINTWILSQAASKLIVVNSESLNLTASDFNDGLHLNSGGSYKVGSLFASAIKSYLPSYKPSSFLFADNAYTLNPFCTGTTGTLSGGATGQVMTGWDIGAANAGGATVVGSKTTDNNLEQQVITLSGTFSANNKSVIIQQYFTTRAPSVGDTVEGIIEFEVISTLTNIVGVNYRFDVWDSGFASVMSGAVNSYRIVDNATLPFAIGTRIVMRTPPQTLTTGVPTQVYQAIDITLNTTPTGTVAVSGAIKIHKVGVRKII